MAFWDDVENAVQAAFAASSGLPNDHVIWKHQNKPAPARPYMTMSFSDVETRGVDYLKQTTDLSRPAGQEVKIEARGFRVVTIDVEAFSDDTLGEPAARAILEKARGTGLILPSVRSLLTAVGVSPFDMGRVGWVPEVVATQFRGRAVCSVRCHMPAEMAFELAGYIARVRGTATITGTRSGATVVRPYMVPAGYAQQLLARQPLHFWLLSDDHFTGLGANAPETDFGTAAPDPVHLIWEEQDLVAVPPIVPNLLTPAQRLVGLNPFASTSFGSFAFAATDPFKMQWWVVPHSFGPAPGNNIFNGIGWSLGLISDMTPDRRVHIRSDGQGGVDELISVAQLVAGQLCMLTVTFDGVTEKLFINGKLNASRPVSQVPRPASQWFINTLYADEDVQALSYETAAGPDALVLDDYNMGLVAG